MRGPDTYHGHGDDNSSIIFNHDFSTVRMISIAAIYYLMVVLFYAPLFLHETSLDIKYWVYKYIYIIIMLQIVRFLESLHETLQLFMLIGSFIVS